MIHVCIPARDEARTLGVLLWKIRKVMAEFGRDYRILVMDDASSDETGDLLERYRKVVPLTVLRTSQPVGYGAALERLLREATEMSEYPKRDSVVVLQADFTESPDAIVPLVKTLEGGADIVAGTSEARTDVPRGLRITRWMAPRVAGRVFRDAPVADPLCGFRAYRIVVLKKAFREVGDAPMLTRDGPAANVELLGRLIHHARRVEESPLELRFDIRRRDSRLRTLPTLAQLFRLGRLDVSWPSREDAA